MVDIRHSEDWEIFQEGIKLSDEYFDYDNPDTDINEVILNGKYIYSFQKDADDSSIYDIYIGKVNGETQIIIKTDFFDSSVYMWNDSLSWELLNGKMEESEYIESVVDMPSSKNKSVIVDELHYNHEPRLKNHLTGKYVTRDLQNIMESLSNDEYVDMRDITSTREIREAEVFAISVKDTSMLKGREAFQKHVCEKMLERGSVNIDIAGKYEYNGIVDKGHRLDIVIGLPASGKSSAVVDDISQEFHSLVIDNDEIKKEIPEYANGWGANSVHKESQLIERYVISKALERGYNIVCPKVGGNVDKIIEIINEAKEHAYNISVHYVELSVNKAIGRMIERYVNTGRYISPAIMEKYVNKIEGNKISNTYEYIKNNNIVNGYSKWNNDVGRGEKPILIEEKCHANFVQRAKEQCNMKVQQHIKRKNSR